MNRIVNRADPLTSRTALGWGLSLAFARCHNYAAICSKTIGCALDVSSDPGHISSSGSAQRYYNRPTDQPVLQEKRIGRYVIESPIPSWRNLFVARDTETARQVALELLAVSEAPAATRTLQQLRRFSSRRHSILFRALDLVSAETRVGFVCEEVPFARLIDELDNGSLTALSICHSVLEVARLLRDAHRHKLVFGHLSLLDVWVCRESTKFVPRLWPRAYTPADVEALLQKAPDEHLALAPEWLSGAAVTARTDVFAVAAFASRILGAFQSIRPVRNLLTAVTPFFATQPHARPWLHELISALERAVKAMRSAERRSVEPPSNGRVEIAPADKTSERVPSSPLHLHEDAQFTVYRPKAVVPDTWCVMLVFAHHAKRERYDEPDPVEEVRRQAESILPEAQRDFQVSISDSRAAVPHEGELRLVPFVNGLEFAH